MEFSSLISELNFVQINYIDNLKKDPNFVGSILELGAHDFVFSMIRTRNSDFFYPCDNYTNPTFTKGEKLTLNEITRRTRQYYDSILQDSENNDTSMREPEAR